MQGPTTIARHASNLHFGVRARQTSCVVLHRRPAMIPDARTVSTISPSAGRRARSPVSKRLVKTQAVGTVIPHQTKPTKEASSRHTPNDIFVCDEESQFYSQCLEKLLVKNSSSNQTVVEFGSGDGTPVIGCLIHSQFSGVIHGFELNRKAAALAHSKAAETHVSERYKIHNGCFFQGMRDIPASCLIANPPYIPAPDDDILMPALYGGEDGANLTRDLMTYGFDSAILLISSYANPVYTLEHARKHGYQVTDFMISPMPFGYYSSEPKVKNWIWKMRSEGKAFCSDNWYLLAGVLLQKRQHLPQKRKSYQAGANSNGNGTGNGHINGHTNGHMNGHINGDNLPRLAREDSLGDCSGLRHRYATAADGADNADEDQMDELIRVMTALR